MGHNVFDPTLGGDADHIVVRFSDANKTTIVSRQFDATDQWIKKDAFSNMRFLSGFDVGVIFLPTAATADANRFPRVSPTDAELLHKEAFVNGYVGVKPTFFVEGRPR